MPANIKLCSVLGASLLALGAIPALAHDRVEPVSVETQGSAARLHNLVLYSDARLAFYDSATPRKSCRDRSGDNHANPNSAARTE